ncbi:response regulator transcription factor [Algoriphagus taiwanensis]|uniref:HTH luxR-type domain-containing protein n=1 Tax=Algoriphagus taiwanensis TaxID=1445656 RepID=A0ABQ6PWA4_9BACT|nr:hypothetical protein Ataiwa_05260 [Algoriphagus taiwanensis]
MFKYLFFRPNSEVDKTLIGLIRSEGFECVISEDLTDAFDKIDSGEIEFIILKSELGKKQVFDLYLSLKSKIGGGRTIFFLVVPRETKKEEVILYLEMGFENLFFLPYNPESVKSKIQKLKISKSSFDLFRSHDFVSWLQLSNKPMALVKNDSVYFANESFLEITLFSKNFESKTFGKLFPLPNNEKEEIDRFRFFSQLSYSITIKNVFFSPNRVFDLKLFRGKFSPSNSYLVEILGQKLNDETMEIKNRSNHLFSVLSQREREVLFLSEKGLQMKEIAVKLSLSVRTIERHRSSILKKTSSSNILEALAKTKN